MNPVLELVLQASSKLLNPCVTKGPNTELNLFSHSHKHSPKCWENVETNAKMSPVLELVLQTSSQLWNLLVTKGPYIELNPTSHTHRDS